MPQIPQINDSTGKSYSSTLNTGRGNNNNGGEQFTVDNTQKPQQLQAASDKNTGNNPQSTIGQKDLIPLAVTVSKNQTLAVETIKDIINADLLNTAKLNGYTELAGELENLNNSLYIPAESLVREMLEQENQNTMFCNEPFYDLLREAADGADDDLKEAIGNMLKAINFSQNKNEITSALSSNLKFLAEYYSPNKGLSESLSLLAERWSSGEAENNFPVLRDQTAVLLKNVSESLLSDHHSQTLLPIIMHNISKYNTNSSMLREYFGQLLSQIPSYELRSELSTAFEQLLPKLFGRTAEDDNAPFTNYTINEQKNQVGNSNFGQENETFRLFSDYIAKNPPEEAAADFSRYVSALHSGMDDKLSVVERIFTELIPDEQVSEAIAEEFSQVGSMEELVDFMNAFLEAMPEGEVADALFDVLEEAVDLLSQENPFEQENPLEQGGALPREGLPPRESMAETGATAQFTARSEGTQANVKHSSIQALTDFVSKNINHPALKSIDSFNASNLLQSMINAPGVMTPLAHFILPLQVENTRAFGELWVDNDDESEVTGKGERVKRYHLFLTFDVDNLGRFEADVYAGGSAVDISLLHPPAFTKKIENVIARVNRIAAGAGYSVSRFETGVLKSPHNLTQIFPKLIERRAGLNVQA